MAGIDDTVVTQLVKGQEGLTLGLASLGEILQKMSDRLEKQDMMDYADEEAKKKEEEEKAAAMEKSAMIKSIAKEVVAMIKQEEHGMPVDAASSKNVGGKDTWPIKGADEGAATVKLDSKTENVQKPIQAMQKHDDVPMEGEEEMEEGAAEYPMEEDEKNDEAPDEMKAMYKELKKALGELNTLKKSMPSLIEEGVNDRLGKMGYKNATNGSKSAPKVRKLGAVDPTRERLTDLNKSDDPKHMVRDLSALSWKELARLRVANDPTYADINKQTGLIDLSIYEDK